MSRAAWAVIALSTLGTFAEFWGIVIVAGREAEVRRAVAQAVSRAAQAARTRAQAIKDRLVRLLLRRRVVRVGSAASAAGVGGVTLRRVMRGSVDERIQRLDDGLLALEGRVHRLEGGLADRIRDETRDPWRGLAYLVVGLAALLAANIISVAT